MSLLDPEVTAVTMMDLNRLVKVLRCNYDALVTRQGDGFWQVQFFVAGNSYFLGTVRGSVRRWRQLDAAIYFLQGNCIGINKVSIKANEWNFCRVGDDY